MILNTNNQLTWQCWAVDGLRLVWTQWQRTTCATVIQVVRLPFCKPPSSVLLWVFCILPASCVCIQIFLHMKNAPFKPYNAGLFTRCLLLLVQNTSSWPLTILYVCLWGGRSWCVRVYVCVCVRVCVCVCVSFPNLGHSLALRSPPLERHGRAPVFGNGCAGSDKQFKEESALM